MAEMIEMTEEDFSLEELVSKVRGKASGAVVTFLGTVRADPGVASLDIEDYREMSLKILKDIRERAIEEHGANSVAIVHRVGPSRPAVSSSRSSRPGPPFGKWGLSKYKQRNWP